MTSFQTCEGAGAARLNVVYEVDYMPAWNTSEGRMHQRLHGHVCHSRTRLDHPIRWDDTRILQHASRTVELVVKEAICIRMTPESSHFNRDGGYDLRLLTYRKLKGGTHTGRTRSTTSQIVRMPSAGHITRRSYKLRSPTP